MKGWYQCQSVIFPMQFGLMTRTVAYRSITTGYSILHWAVGHVWWLFLGLRYWYPIILVKSLQHIWRLGTRKWNLRVPYLQMSCSDLVIATHLKVARIPFVAKVENRSGLQFTTDAQYCPCWYNLWTPVSGEAVQVLYVFTEWTTITSVWLWKAVWILPILESKCQTNTSTDHDGKKTKNKTKKTTNHDGHMWPFDAETEN